MRSSLRRFNKQDFFLCICIFNIARGVFNINPIFCMVVNILCSHAFSTTVMTKKQWHEKTTLQQQLIVVDAVTRQIVYFTPIKSLIKWNGDIALHVSCFLDHFKSLLDSKSCQPISEFSRYHCIIEFFRERLI